MYTKILRPVLVVGLFAATSLAGNESSGELIELEAFISEEDDPSLQEDIQPIAVRLDSSFGEDLTILDIPRGLSVLSEVTRDIFGVDDYDTLSRYGAGTQRVNYFGLSGSAFLRGARAGSYFNGMLRAYQRNEMPMSFGSLDALEVVKGPSPSSYTPTLIGGYVNQRPKSPFFDQAKYRIELELGSNDHRRLQIDAGAPFVFMGRPSAYRLSVTVNESDRYYSDVPHEFVSAYGAVKTKLNERTRLFFGGEYYKFDSREIAGINRPTQRLVDEGQYVIGEPVNISSSDWGGTVARPLIEFPTSLVVNPQLFALSVPGDIVRKQVAADLIADLVYLGNAANLDSVYSTLPSEQIPDDFAWAVDSVQSILSTIEKVPLDAYLYTQEYFNNGGSVITEKLDQRAVLADPQDKAESENVILFADYEVQVDLDTKLIIKSFFEWLESEKASSYGFAMNTEQLIANIKIEYRKELESIGLEYRAGVDMRYSYAEMLQDFDAEPFSRRDISLATISSNSVVYAGSDVGPDGLNYWSSFGGASQKSHLWQTAAYLSGAKDLISSLKLHFGLRLEQVWFDTRLPEAVDRVITERPREQDDLQMWTFHLNPIWTINAVTRFYGAFQTGRVISPADGGTIAGKSSFTKAELLEAGFKFDLLNGRLFTQFSAYHWDQATYSVRDAAARPLRGSGLEFEAVWNVSDQFSLISSFTAQRVYLRADSLGFGARPQTEEGWALNGGILNASAPRFAPENPEMVFAGLPEVTANSYLIYDLSSEIQFGLGLSYRDGFWHDMQRSVRIPSVYLWDAHASYTRDNWWIRLRVENIADEMYWIGQEPIFSANTLILQGEGRYLELSFGMEF